MDQYTAEPLTGEAFRNYGHVIEVPSLQVKGTTANQGSAIRFNYLATLSNLRNSGQSGVEEMLKSPEAKLNICLFRSRPRELPFTVKLLERHKYSSQMFIPMTNNYAAYLVVVTLNDPVNEKPDMSTLRVFIGGQQQAFNYNSGVWHHPMIALYSQVDFVCLVYERNKDQLSETEDCEEIYFPSNPIMLRVGLKANL